MTTTPEKPTNDGTGPKVYKEYINENNTYGVTGLPNWTIGDRVTAANIANAMRIAHAAREPEIAELREKLDEAQSGVGQHAATIARLTAEVGRLGSLLGCDSGHECLRCKTHIYGMFISSGSEGKFYCPICWERVQCESALSQLSACERERDDWKAKALDRLNRLREMTISRDSLTARLRKAEDALREIHNEAPDGVARMALAALTSLRTPPSEGKAEPEEDDSLYSAGGVDLLAKYDKPTAPCRTCGGTKVVVDQPEDEEGPATYKTCPTCCPASEDRCDTCGGPKVATGHWAGVCPNSFHVPPPAPSAFKARRWVGECDEGWYYQTREDGTLWFHRPDGTALKCLNFGVAHLKCNPQHYREVPIPTPKEEVCDGPSPSLPSGTPSAASPASPLPPSDPPATRDAGEGLKRYSMSVARHGWNSVVATEDPDGDWVVYADAAGRASVSPAPHAEFVAAGLSLADLRAANATRATRWDNGAKPPLTFALTELAGEVGEACNAGKKLARAEMGMAGGTTDTTNLAEELGDVVICADLVAWRAGIDLGKAVAAKFNATSQKYGFAERLALAPAQEGM